MSSTRRADPYRDLDVIDARAPRVNQFVVGLLSLATVVTGWWGLVAAMALQLVIGLQFGRRYCLPCVLYFEVLQPRLGEGPLEDSRPPRFANILGAVFLTSSALAYLMGIRWLGTLLAAAVAVLALLAAVTGFCLGCEIYKLIAHVRGVKPGGAQRVDLTELGAASEGEFVVQFTHPLCSGCGPLSRKLAEQGHEVLLVDVSKHRDLASKYHVTVVPFVLKVARDGAVVERLA